MNIEFINTAKNTRNGFYHKTELYIDSEFILECKCNYLNRTWESYPYQSVMKDALYQLRFVHFLLFDVFHSDITCVCG